MRHLRIALLTALTLANTGCDSLPESVVYFFSTGGSLRHSTSAAEEEPGDFATLVIRSLWPGEDD